MLYFEVYFLCTIKLSYKSVKIHKTTFKILQGRVFCIHNSSTPIWLQTFDGKKIENKKQS